MQIASHGDIRDREAVSASLTSLQRFVDGADPRQAFTSIVLLFPETPSLDEIEFEKVLWHLLSAIAERDPAGWAPEVSADVKSPLFGFSVHSHPFFIVGMHPNSSRPSRRAPYAALAFNSHVQFEALKSEGTYGALQYKIRQRELERYGAINPMLAEHGVKSEAPQYSGRFVGADWHCPFSAEPDGQAS